MADIRITPAIGAVHVTGSAEFRGTGGSSLLFITGSGGIGAGTTDPQSEFHVKGSQTRFITLDRTGVNSWDLGVNSSKTFLITDNTAQVDRLAITLSGSVGIGTTNPAYKLDLVGNFRIKSNSEQQVRFVHYAGTGNEFSIEHDNASLYFYNRATSSGSLKIKNSSQIQLVHYGSGNYSGTAAYSLNVDSSGNIIESTLANINGLGTANYITKWTDSDTLTNSVIYETGGSIGIGLITPREKLEVNGQAFLHSGLFQVSQTDHTNVSSANEYINHTGPVRIEGSGANINQYGTFKGYQAVYGSGSHGWDAYTQGGYAHPILEFYSGNNGSHPFPAGSAFSSGYLYQFVKGPDFAGGGGGAAITSSNSELVWGITNSKYGYFANRVGIGTTSPLQTFDVNGVGYFRGGTALDFGAGDTPSDAAIIIEENDYIYTRDNNNLRKLIGKSGSDIIYIGQNGTSLIDAIALQAGQSGYVSVQNTTNGEYARFTGGSLGIGTTAPDHNLHVNGNARVRGLTSDNSTLQVWGLGGGSGQYGGLHLIKTQDTGSDFVFQAYHAGVGYATSSPKIYFAHYDASPTSGSVMVIDTNTERVGIGLTNPIYPFDVNGNIGVRGGQFHTNSSTDSYRFLSSTAAKAVRARGLQVSTTYSGTIPDNGILFATDTNLYRSAADTLKTDDNFIVGGNLTVDGIVVAKEFHTTFVSASIIYQSGSTQFGDTADDIHIFSGSNTIRVNQTTAAFTDPGLKIWPLSTTNNTGLTSINLGTSPLDNYGVSLSGWRYGTNGDPKFTIKMHYNSAAGTDVLTINSTGNVGIGTVSPTGLLNLNSNSAAAEAGGVVNINGGVNAIFNSTERFIFNIDSDSSQTDRTFDIAANRSGSSGGDLLFRIQEDGNVGVGTSSPVGRFNSYITDNRQVAHNGTGGDLFVISDNNSKPVFYVKGTGTADLVNVFDNTTEVFTILDGGNVGIGTASPKATLDVAGDANEGIRIGSGNALLGATSGGAGADTQLIYWSGTNAYYGRYTTGYTGKVMSHSFRANGATKLFVTGSGVHVGSTTGADVPLLVKSDSSTADQISLEHSGNTVKIVSIGQLDSHGSIVIRQNSGVEKIRLHSSASSYINTGFNVGIGTASPTAQLHVYSSGNGEIEVQRASGALFNIQAQASLATIGTDSNHPLYLKTNAGTRVEVSTAGAVKFNSYGSGTRTGTAAYNLSVDASGNIIETANPATGVVDGSGTANYIPKWSDSDTLTDSNMYQDANGNIGVGTTSPQRKLDVRGGYFMTSDGSGKEAAFVQGGTGYAYFGNLNAGAAAFGNSEDWTTLVADGGNIGIGSTAPSAKLNVVGGADVLVVEGSGSTSNTTIMAVDGNNGRLFEVSDDLSDSLFSVNTIAGLPVMEAFADNVVTLGAYNQYDLHITGSRVGIGVSSPSDKLEVAGVIKSIGGTNNAKYSQIYVNDSYAYYTTNAGIIYMNTELQVNTGRIGSYDENLSLETSGTTRITVQNSDGNVGIGTAAPASTLHLSAASPYIFLDDTSTSGTRPRAEIKSGDVGVIQSLLFGFNNTAGTNLLEVLVVNESGKVGVGTTAPSEKLTVQGNISASGLVYVPNIGTGTDDSVVILDSDGTLRTDEIDSRVWGSSLVDGSGTANRVAYWSDANTLTNDADFFFDGTSVGVGTTSPNARLEVNVSTTGSAGDGYALRYGANQVHYWNLADQWTSRFQIGSTAGNWRWDNSGGIRMVLNANGNLGVGTSSPAYTFEIQKSIDNGLLSRIYNTSTTNGQGLLIRAGETNISTRVFEVASRDDTKVMTVTSNGRVGIGTNNPLNILDVRGGRSYFSPSGDSNSGTSSHAIEVWNANDGVFTANALTAYNAHTSWDIGSKAAYTISPRPQNGSIYTHAGEGAATSVAIQRFVQFNSSNTAPLLDWTFFQWDGAGTAATDLKKPANLWTVKTYENAATVEKLSLSGDGDLSIAGDLNVDGIIVAKEFHTTFVSASIVYQSGSTQFGNSSDDTHIFTGNVGINTSSPASTLHVNKSGTTNVQTIVAGLSSDSLRPVLQFSETSNIAITTGMSIEYDGRGSGTTNRMYINDVNGNPQFTVMSGGNVGIGTTDPGVKLHVLSSIEETLRLEGSNNTTAIHFWSGSNRTGILGHSNGTSIASAADPGDMVLRSESGKKVHIATNGASARMTVNSAGKVGIGNTEPLQTLSVSGVINSDTSNDYYGAWLLGNSTAGNDSYLGLGPWYSQAGYVKWIDNSRLSIYTYSTSKHVTLQEAGGRVGIGLTNPGAILDVNHPDGTTNIIRASSGSGNYRFRVDQYFDLYMTNAGGTDKLAIKNDGTIYAPNLGTGADNSVVILDSDGYLKTDEVDSRVWGSSLVDGSGTANYITKWSDSNSLTNSVMYESASFIGINTTSPGSRLSIDDGNLEFRTTNTSTYKNEIIFSETSWGDRSFYIQHDGSGGGDDNLLKIFGDGAGSYDAGITIRRGGAVQIGDGTYTIPTNSPFSASMAQLILAGAHNLNQNNSSPSAKLLITGYDNDGTTPIYPVYIEDENGNVDFWIKNRTSSGTVGPTMYFPGSVGIGVTNPDYAKVTVSATNHQAFAVTRNGNNVPALFLGNDGGTTPRIAANNADLQIGRDLSDTFTSYVTVKNGSGNIGIGTSFTNPSYRLHVSSSSGIQQQIAVSAPTGTGRSIVFVESTGGNYTNFLVGAQYNVNSAFEITPSTTQGATDFDTPAFIVDAVGNVGIGAAPSRTLHIQKSTNGGQVRAQVHNTSNTANSHGILSIYTAGSSAGDPFVHWKVDGQTDWSAGIDNSDSDKFKISKNFGPGTNDYLVITTDGKVQAPQAFEASGLVMYNTTGNDTGAGIANGFTASLQPGVTTMNTSYDYRVTLTTTGTGTVNGASYIVGYDGNSWTAREVGRSGTSSNHPELTTAGNSIIIYDDHTSTYTIHYRVETYYRGNAGTTLHTFGADYHWQRTSNTLSYTDGNVGIGVTNPAGHLQVNASSDAQVLVTADNAMSLHQDAAWNSNILFGAKWDGSNQVYGATTRGAFKMVALHDADNSPQYLAIYGANHGTAGGTITWNTVGFAQDEDGQVGIGTTAPISKLEVNGAIVAGGDGTGTAGTLVLTDNYSGDDHLANIGWLRSSGGVYLAYGVKQQGSADWVSTFDNFSGERSYLTLDEDSMTLAHATANQTTVGSAITMTEKVKFDIQNTRLGMGTTAPGAAIHITGSDTGNREFKVLGGSLGHSLEIVDKVGYTTSVPNIYIQDADSQGARATMHITSNNGAIDSLWVGSTGYIGIGTVAPAARLHIYDGGVSNTATTDMLKLQAYVGDFGATPAAIALAFKFQDSNNSTNEARIRMATVNDTDYGDNDEAASNLIFSTTNDGAESDKMIITGRGDIGIGTVNPSYKLDVVGNLRINEGNAFTDLDIKSDRTSGNIGGVNFVNASDTIKGQIYGNTDGSVRIGTNGTDLAVLINAAGNVGIGTDTPASKLNVVGSADVLVVEGSGSTANTTIMAVDGNNGRLFEVSDDLSDSLFSVNTIAGLPVMEAFADNTVVLGAYNQCDLVVTGSKVGIGTCSPFRKLHVVAETSQTEALVIEGNDSLGKQLVLGYNPTGNGYGTIQTVYQGTAWTDLAINSSGGNVGIGTTAPSYKLHVDNDTANTNNAALYVRNPNSSTAAVIAEFVGDSDSIQIKNIGVGDYTIYNTQQSNGIALYDGVGGVEIHYAGSTVLEADSNGGIKVTGQLSATADVIAYSSDERLKENIKPIENAVDKVKQMRGVTFDWNEKSEELGFEPTTKFNDVGVIAQEVEKVFPQLIAHAPFDIDNDEEGNTISKSGEDYKTVNYSRLTAVLIEAIKEQQLQIEELKKEIKKLKQ